jgi:hypothetical protein
VPSQLEHLATALKLLTATAKTITAAITPNTQPKPWPKPPDAEFWG